MRSNLAAVVSPTRYARIRGKFGGKTLIHPNSHLQDFFENNVCRFSPYQSMGSTTSRKCGGVSWSTPRGYVPCVKENKCSFDPLLIISHNINIVEQHIWIYIYIYIFIYLFMYLFIYHISLPGLVFLCFKSPNLRVSISFLVQLAHYPLVI